MLHATSPILVTTIRDVLSPGSAHPAFVEEGTQEEEVTEGADRHADDGACSGAWPTNACAASVAKKSSDSPAEAFMIPCCLLEREAIAYWFVGGYGGMVKIHDTVIIETHYRDPGTFPKFSEFSMIPRKIPVKDTPPRVGVWSDINRARESFARRS